MSGLVEIFQGETQLTVVEGVNPLVMRLSPILDNRSLTIPRITRIERPFQLETEELVVVVERPARGGLHDAHRFGSRRGRPEEVPVVLVRVGVGARAGEHGAVPLQPALRGPSVG